VLALLERGQLTEGHGRAVLQVADQDRRVQVAKRAAAEGWSVRETERQAGAGAKRTSRRSGGRISAEERAAMADAEDVLGQRSARTSRCGARATGVKAELRFDDLAELESLARRLGKRS